jgi:gamma-glutamyltranspeptidase/glutathione hydrolase
VRTICPDAIASAGEKREKMGAVPGDTVHFDIVDKAGNMVSSTPSGRLAAFLAGHPRTRLPLGTRAQMFWLEEGHPASLAPGKRPRSTLTPTMALRDGEPYLAWGSPGGDQQDQWITQFFLRHVHAGMNLQEAIDAPGLAHRAFPLLVLAAHRAPGRRRGRRPRAEGDAGRIEEARPQARKSVPDWSEGA